MDNGEGRRMLPAKGADGFGRLILWHKIPTPVGDIIATMKARLKALMFERSLSQLRRICYRNGGSSSRLVMTWKGGSA
jgi:hypothetical protein